MAQLEIKADSHILPITHPDKILFPEDNITKEEFVEYYHHVADVMIPHLKGRPVTMYRFHDSVKGEGFYQQQIPASAPDWVNRVTVKKEGGITTHVLCDDTATLIYLANQNCITIHTWLSRNGHLEQPDEMIFDFDPPDDNFEPVRQGAKLLKSLLDRLELTSFLKTTGSRGLHVVIPLNGTDNFESVRSLAQEIASVMVRKEPDRYTTEQRKQKRGRRIFIDTLRNTYAHTAVAPYSVRAQKGAPIAAPLFWNELEDRKIRAGSFNIRNIFQRLERQGDPWKDKESQTQDLRSILHQLKDKHVDF